MNFPYIPMLNEALLDRKALMTEALEAIWKHPETGFREWFAHGYLKKAFEGMGYTLTEAGNIPGFYTDVDTGRPGPMLLIMGELDSILCASHPEADPVTGAVHACGHCAQTAALLGIASVLSQPKMLRNLCGKIRLMAVPAEELLEITYREELKRKGIIRYLGGKVEFMHRGFMDGVDISFMVHTSGGRGMGIQKGGNGCITKTITYKGKAAHAGGAPHDGINALYAANLGMTAVNALRETFKDEDHIRFHPVVATAGGAVNVIPDMVGMESYVRGASLESIVSVNRRVNRALAGAAAAMGAQVHLRDLPGYMPLWNDPTLYKLAGEVMHGVVPDPLQVQVDDQWNTGCTDMGDISAVMPAIQPYCGGAVGTGHGMDYFVADPDIALRQSALFQLTLAFALLEHDGERARRVLDNAHPLFACKADYFAAIDALELDADAVTYGDTGTTLRF